MRHFFVALLQLWLIGPPLYCLAQGQPATVKIRFGRLDTTAYPAPGHSTEWAQELFADLYDSSGKSMPPSLNLRYDWGVDFCRGLGMLFGWASGNGLCNIRPDGNKIKNEPGCCDECPFQTYLVAVRVHLEDAYIQSATVRIPNIQIPSEPGLSSSYPNPFSLRTAIKFQLNHASHVQLRVYDVLGRLAAELVNNQLPPGYHAVPWQPSDAAQGIYFYRLVISPDRGPVSTYTQKMLLVR